MSIDLSKKRAYDKMWREKNREKIKAYYLKNRDRILANTRELYKNNKERYDGYGMRYKLKNPKKYKAMMVKSNRKYYIKNAGIRRAKSRKYYWEHINDAGWAEKQRASSAKWRDSKRGKIWYKKWKRDTRAKYRRCNIAWQASNPEKCRAHYLVKSAIKSGKLVKQPCEVCGTTGEVFAHHDDYSRPCDVRWMCRLHHARHHAKMKTKKKTSLSTKIVDICSRVLS